MYPRLTTLAGHAAFFGLMAELKDPRDFPKAICLLQGLDISLYILAAVVIYRYGGPDVSSPALGSAGPILSKIAYGIALPTVSPPTLPSITQRKHPLTEPDHHRRRD